MDYPLSTLVTDPSAPSQRAFADVAARVFISSNTARLIATDDGLKIEALTELDLELAFDEVRKSFPAARRGKPQVTYVFEPKFLEPCYIATIHVPDECTSKVMADLGARRAVVVSMKHDADEAQIVVDIPVAETFGYSTTLRSLTQGRGRYSVAAGRQRSAGAQGNDAA